MRRPPSALFTSNSSSVGVPCRAVGLWVFVFDFYQFVPFWSLLVMVCVFAAGVFNTSLKQGIISFLAFLSGRSTSSSVLGCLIGAIESIPGPLPISLKFLRPVSILLLEIDALFTLERNHHVYSLTFVSTFGLDLCRLVALEEKCFLPAYVYSTAFHQF
ncbi:hypothetical protein Bca52824_083342 [Brassica carinata]|uniref:Uncharacterized protein n=1 Tax=Brassica carinata TaxID=52824 RepID=A0A8X7TV61_BRACI|nr:hypothetical protein Bca52824_083342 [Brassica carinata]